MVQLEKAPSDYFTVDEINEIDSAKIPKHIAIIPDGNRRWAKSRSVSSTLGHHMGAEGVVNIVAAARDLGVKHLTFYAFSTENWKRSKEEVGALMHILALMLRRETPKMVDEGICFNTIGDT